MNEGDTMKKTGALLLTLTLLVSIMVLPTQAVSNNTPDVEVVYTESGDFEIVTTTIIYDSMARSSSKSADRIREVKYDGKLIAKITLSATFGYDGKTAWVSSASGSHTTYDRWNYGSETISKSGRTASLNAKLSHSIHGTLAIDNLSLTCSPSGQIS